MKLAGLGRYIGSPNDAGDGAIGWGVGRYIVNGFGLDAFANADGEGHTIEAFAGAIQVRQQLTDTFAFAVAYGRSGFNDSRVDSDLDHVDTVH